jgi:hypothetical protein
MNDTSGSIREFLLWIADPENSGRIRDWGHESGNARGSLRDQFRTQFDDLSDEDWDFLQQGDFALLRNICSDKVMFNLVMMTSVPEPTKK